MNILVREIRNTEKYTQESDSILTQKHRDQLLTTASSNNRFIITFLTLIFKIGCYSNTSILQNAPSCPLLHPGLGSLSLGGCLSPFKLLEHNTIGWIAYKQQNLISYNSRGWKSKMRLPTWSGEGSFPDCKCLVVSSHGQASLGSLFYKALIPIMRPPSIT